MDRSGGEKSARIKSLLEIDENKSTEANDLIEVYDDLSVCQAN